MRETWLLLDFLPKPKISYTTSHRLDQIESRFQIYKRKQTKDLLIDYKVSPANEPRTGHFMISRTVLGKGRSLKNVGGTTVISGTLTRDEFDTLTQIQGIAIQSHWMLYTIFVIYSVLNLYFISTPEFRRLDVGARLGVGITFGTMVFIMYYIYRRMKWYRRQFIKEFTELIPDKDKLM
jgi:hypothetical protein